MADAGTPAPPAGETEKSPALENNAQPGAGTPAPSAAEVALEAERKARQQAEMRASQLENEKREREQKELQDQGKFKELADKQAQEIADLKAQRELDGILDGQPDSVKKTFKKIMSSGTAQEQLDALHEAIEGKKPAEGQDPQKPAEPKVEPLNPNPQQTQHIQKSEESLADMEERLQKETAGKGF